MAVESNTVVINGTNLGDHGLTWHTRRGYQSSPPGKIIVHKLPGAAGALFQAREENAPRTITLTGDIIGDTMSDMYTKIDSIQSVLTGLLQIVFPDDSGRQISGRLRDIDISGNAVIPHVSYTATLVCPDPRRFSTAVTSVGSGADAPTGTAKVGPSITITGPSANPTTITLTDYNGATVSAFTMAAALLSGETWLIDTELGKIQHDDGAGTVTSALADFSGTLPWVDPEDADFATSSWPKFTATAGSPASIAVVYNRAWR